MMRRIVVGIILWFAGGMVLLQSLVTAVRWWQGEIAVMEAIDWLWLGLLLPMLYVYLRYVSIFGCRKPVCLTPEDQREQKTIEPQRRGDAEKPE